MRLTRRTRVIAIFWAVAAVVAWNAVFDRVIVLAGRQYIRAAVAADQAGSSLAIADWMEPAVVRAFRQATAVGVGVAILGFLAVRRSARREAEEKSDGPAKAGPHVR
jgi:hypothetical protein